MRRPYVFALVQFTRFRPVRGVLRTASTDSIVLHKCGHSVGTKVRARVVYVSSLPPAARRAHGSSAEHAMRDLIASHAPLRNGSHKARQNGPKHYPGDSRGRQIGAPPKPNEVGLVGRGGAAERLSFCPERQNEGCGACDDEARLSPLSFVVQRKIGPPEVVLKREYR